MRAVFCADSKISLGSYSIDGESAYHLIKVIRIKVGEKVLILNGKGGKYRSQVIEVNKKSVLVNIEEIEKVEVCLSHKIDIGICLPKKEAFYEMLRQSVELGVGKILPIKSKFSQIDFLKDNKYEIKIQKIIESAVIQSNNPFATRVATQISFNQINEVASTYDVIIYLCSHTLDTIGADNLHFNHESKILLIIGPEAGLDITEERELNTISGLNNVHLPVPIMKAQTALPVAVGYILGQLHDT